MYIIGYSGSPVNKLKIVVDTRALVCHNICMVVHWTHNERVILTKFYGKVTSEELLKLLPGKTMDAIRSQVYYLRKRGWGL